jgi:outer membrane protein OmpA-like peptidoglycan-associated protein
MIQVKYLLAAALTIWLINNAVAQPIIELDSQKVTIENCGEVVNSKYNDYGSLLMRNNLYFTSNRPIINNTEKKSRKSIEHIYQSIFPDTTKIPLKVQDVTSLFIGKYSNGSIVYISPDEMQLITYISVKNRKGNLFQSTQMEGGSWSPLQPFPEPINSKHHESSACLSVDGKTLFFVSKRPNGIGKRDIWTSTKNNNGGWTAPINLGRTVNSASDEEAVFLDQSGKTLYFSSNKKGGYGGFDIYQTELIDNVWSTPKNMGLPFNSPNNDLFFTLLKDEKSAFLSSDREGTLGNLDLYRVTQNEKPNKSINRNREIDSILIAKAKSDSLLYAQKTIETNAREEKQNNRDYYNYIANSDPHFERIHFAFGDSTITTFSRKKIDELFLLMKSIGNVKVVIGGYSDNIGTEEFNLILSAARARAVVNYLIKKGINKEQISYFAKGELSPLDTQETSEARARNRRVEIFVLSPP